jgi:hypothetical protein
MIHVQCLDFFFLHDFCLGCKTSKSHEILRRGAENESPINLIHIDIVLFFQNKSDKLENYTFLKQCCMYLVIEFSCVPQEFHIFLRLKMFYFWSVGLAGFRRASWVGALCDRRTGGSVTD